MWAVILLGVSLGAAVLLPVIVAVAVTEAIAIKAGKP
jgi:hypothetical protein